VGLFWGGLVLGASYDELLGSAAEGPLALSLDCKVGGRCSRGTFLTSCGG
jgi:hypothetical protein